MADKVKKRMFIYAFNIWLNNKLAKKLPDEDTEENYIYNATDVILDDIFDLRSVIKKEQGI